MDDGSKPQHATSITVGHTRLSLVRTSLGLLRHARSDNRTITWLSELESRRRRFELVVLAAIWLVIASLAVWQALRGQWFLHQLTTGGYIVATAWVAAVMVLLRSPYIGRQSLAESPAVGSPATCRTCRPGGLTALMR